MTTAAQQAREDDDKAKADAKKHAEADARAAAKQDEEEVEEREKFSGPGKLGQHAYPLAMYRKAADESKPHLSETAHNLEEEKALLGRGYVNGHEFYTKHNKEVAAGKHEPERHEAEKR